AEDGIRVFHVTGVQTCALPISFMILFQISKVVSRKSTGEVIPAMFTTAPVGGSSPAATRAATAAWAAATEDSSATSIWWPNAGRSEERRVGKECRCGRGADMAQ